MDNYCHLPWHDHHGENGDRDVPGDMDSILAESGTEK